MDTQALSQYQEALVELQQSKTLLQEEKRRQLQQEITNLQNMMQQMKSQHIMRLQQQYLQKQFDTIIMAHPQIQALQKQLQEEIFLLLQSKHEATKSRQIKQLIITHETKQIKLRKQLDQQIKSKIYYSSGLEQLKHEIKQSKTQMGSQKSEYNLRLKRIQSEIKQYQQKISVIQKMCDLERLEEEYQQLKIELLQQEGNQCQGQKIKNSSKRRRNTNNNNKNNDNNNDSDEDQQDQYKDNNNNHDEEIVDGDDDQDQKQVQLNNEEQQYDSSNNPQNYYYSAESQGYNTYQPHNGPTHKENHLNTHKNKFDLTAYFNHYLQQNQQKHEGNHQQVTMTNYPIAITNTNQQNRSLLNLKNISAILKQKVTQQDPLQRYIQSSLKQNNSNNTNNNIKPNQSNFTQLYQQHLKNLNKGFAKKAAALNNNKNKIKQTIGLSQMAKKTIIRNLAQYHKSNFSNNSVTATKQQQQQQSKRVSTFQEQQPQGYNNAYGNNILVGGGCV